MTHRYIRGLALAVMLATLIGTPSLGRTQTVEQRDGVFHLGSFVLSVLYVPVKLVTCLGTQAGAAVLYTATYGVAGTQDGDTNGKEIGEVARRSCSGPWIITAEQVKEDYGE